MKFHPEYIKLDHVLKAVSRIEKEGFELATSTKYDVVIDGKRYPPKEIMRFARYELDKKYDWNYGGGEPTNKYLRAMGFEIVNKEEEPRETKINMLLERYKDLIGKKGLDQERYKWELVQKNLGCPDMTAEDFNAEMERLDMSNLPYQMVRAVIKHLIEEKPEEYRECLALIYDKNKNLDDRIKNFDAQLQVLYNSILGNKKLSHHHDERTISILLTYHNPTKYTFYKESYYMKYCKYLGVPHIKAKGEKYSHYLKLIYELADYISQDKNLVHLIGSQMNENCYTDTKHLILAQDVLYQCFDSFNKTYNKENTDNEMNVSKSLNQILYGPPGTGKTYNTINYAVRIVNPSFDLSQDRAIIKEEFNRLVEEGSVRFITFHQSFSYEDFVEGIKPLTVSHVNDNGEIMKDVVYEIEDGIFKQLCKQANGKCVNIDYSLLVGKNLGKSTVVNVTPEVITLSKPQGGEMLIPMELLLELEQYVTDNQIDLLKQRKIESSDVDRAHYPKLEPYIVNGYTNFIPELLELLKLKSQEQERNRQNYVLIIDEINRGNIASIFGELITLIEEDKREGGKEALSTILPYSKEKFSVPNNVYIIGTMNTADRSVEALDIALRRRFSFAEMAPDSSKIKDEIVEDIDLKSLLDIINLRIEKLLDKDHRIGHAYFMKVNSKDDLKIVFKDKIIPLLEEYFFGDYSKIGLVLGEKFVQRAEFDLDFSFAQFDNDDQSDLLDKPIYELTDCKDWDFKSIL